MGSKDISLNQTGVNQALVVAESLKGGARALELSGPVLVVAHGGVYFAMQRALKWSVVDLKNCAVLHYQPPASSLQSWIIGEG